MKNIVSIGEVLIDSYLNLDVGETKYEVGGASFNVACSISALKKNKSYFMGALSDDNFGKEIEKLILKYGIQKDFIQVTKNITTIAHVTLDKHKDRSFNFIRNSDDDFDLDNFDNDLINNIDFIHFGSATAFLPGKLRDSYLKLLNLALKNNIKFSFDPNFRETLWVTQKDIIDFKNDCKLFMENASIIKLSLEELYLLTGINDEKKAFENICRFNKKALICITRGSDSTLCFWSEKIFNVDIFKCESILDTTGAGDAFISNLVSDYVSENINKKSEFSSIVKIVSNSNFFANKCVQQYGAISFLNNLNK